MEKLVFSLETNRCSFVTTLIRIRIRVRVRVRVRGRVRVRLRVRVRNKSVYSLMTALRDEPSSRPRRVQ